MSNAKVKVETTHVNLTPLGMAKMSNGFFQASENYSATDMPLLNFFLYSASIELGLKASILSTDNSKTRKGFVKNNLGHDLEKSYIEFQQCFPQDNLLNVNDIKAVKKINPFYKQKGLEYITLPVIMALMKGMKEFPELSELREAAAKINQFLLRHKHFING